MYYMYTYIHIYIYIYIDFPKNKQNSSPERVNLRRLCSTRGARRGSRSPIGSGRSPEPRERAIGDSTRGGREEEIVKAPTNFRNLLEIALDFGLCKGSQKLLAGFVPCSAIVSAPTHLNPTLQLQNTGSTVWDGPFTTVDEGECLPVLTRTPFVELLGPAV